MTLNTLRISMALVVASAVALSGCTKERELVSVKLKNGDLYTGALVTKDANTVTVVTTQGASMTFLNRQIESMVVQKKQAEAPAAMTPASTTPAANATSAPAAVPAPEPANFSPPTAGTMTLRAGTLLEFRTDVAIDASELEIGTLATATTVDDVHADGAVIPANSTLNLMLAAKPNTGAREILCSLTGVFPRGHAYRPAVNANEADNKGALLGSVMAPSKDGLPSQLRDLPFRITARSLLSIKLVNNITLREAK